MKQGAGTLLLLPDGRIALQRRTKDAPHAAGKLGIFGGLKEPGEAPGACVRRELGEETSLPIGELEFDYKVCVTVSAEEAESGIAFRSYLYTTRINNMEFDVFEGDGAEAYTIDELRVRSDLTSVLRRGLSEIFGGHYGNPAKK